MKKQDGFPGQLSYVIPDRILERVRQMPLVSDLYVTDIGYYPRARHHFRARESGVSQAILIYSVEGKGSVTIGNTCHELPPDHFFVIPEGMPHAYCADEYDPWSIYWIHFTGSKAPLFCRRPPQAIAIGRDKASRINERLDLFSEIFRNLERGYAVETLEYVNLCLGYLLASFTHPNQYRLVRQARERDPVAQSINVMLANVSRKLTLGDLAGAAGVSVSYYSRLFLARTGHSPIEYFIQLKIRQACRLLDNTDWSVAEVARETGFEDQFYFSRQFRRVMNMSPREYRKR